MSATTLIHPDKVRAYLATDYRLGHTDSDFVLTIGERSVPLAGLFAQCEADCGAFLTAFNPWGSQQPDSFNEIAHGKLVRHLQKLGVDIIEGSGSDSGGDWPIEKSCFGLGLRLDDARSIGRHFNQDAIVWVGADATPQLILLR